MTTFQSPRRAIPDGSTGPMNDPVDEPKVFVVRVWHRTAGFRATAREVHCDETLSFSEPDKLLRFLASGAETAPGRDMEAPAKRDRER